MALWEENVEERKVQMEPREHILPQKPIGKFQKESGQ